ncbi:MAG: TasA family protein, partial [Dehalococcoidales bacterium]
MKKILGLTIVALMVMGLVGGGTWAYFSDPETSTGNILTAGTLDLNIDGGDVNVTILSLTNAAPGDSGGNSATLANVGNLAGELDITLVTIASDEVSDEEPEVEAGDVTGFALDPGAGELDANIWLAFWLDYEAGGSWSANDIYLTSNATGAVTYSADLDSGTSTSGTFLTVTDTGQSWTVDTYKGFPVTVSGKGTRVIISNTSDLTFFLVKISLRLLYIISLCLFIT